MQPFKILLADDSSTIQKVVELTLSQENCQLEFARSEDELLQKVEKNSYHLVILDFALSSRKSGLKLAKKIREMRDSIRILFLFSTFDNIDEESIRNLGYCDKLVKPFDSASLLVCFKTLLLSGDANSNLTGPQDLELGENFKESQSAEQILEQKSSITQEMKNIQERLADAEGSRDKGKGALSDLVLDSDPHLLDEDEWTMGEVQVKGRGLSHLKENTEKSQTQLTKKTSTDLTLDLDPDAKLDFDEDDMEWDDDDTAPEIDLNQLQGDLGDWNLEVPDTKAKKSRPAQEVMEVPEKEKTERQSSLQVGHDTLRVDSKIIKSEQGEGRTSEMNMNKSIVEKRESLNEITLPDQKELEYPERAAVNSNTKTNSMSVTTSISSKASEEIGESTGPIHYKNIKEVIEEDQTITDFWKVDEVQLPGMGLASRIDIASVRPLLAEQVVVAKGQETTSRDLNEEKKLEENIRIDSQMIETIVRRECLKIIEKVAWEVIPDLAENIIKREIDHLSKMVQDNQGLMGK